MKFEEVLPALREGKKITNSIIKNWRYKYIYYKDGTMFNDKGGFWYLTYSEFIENDGWEIVEETKKVKLRDLTAKQYKTFVDSKCGNQIVGIGCIDCPFYHVSCLYGKDNKCWIDNKDLYSDKFLDQEIEIDD